MSIGARLKDVAVSDNGFLFDPYTGLTFSVNRTGKIILERLRDGLDPAGVERALAVELEVAPGDDPGRDVREFIIMLREAGLLPRDGEA